MEANVSEPSAAATAAATAADKHFTPPAQPCSREAAFPGGGSRQDPAPGQKATTHLRKRTLQNPS
jgi:hypothetical protein